MVILPHKTKVHLTKKTVVNFIRLPISNDALQTFKILYKYEIHP